MSYLDFDSSNSESFIRSCTDYPTRIYGYILVIATSVIVLSRSWMIVLVNDGDWPIRSWMIVLDNDGDAPIII